MNVSNFTGTAVVSTNDEGLIDAWSGQSVSCVKLTLGWLEEEARENIEKE